MTRDLQAEIDAGRRRLDQHVEAAIKRSQRVGAKPTLQRYAWSRLHTDLLDDNRWALVAHRAQAPLPVVEALITRLEIEANKTQPRGFIGDFSAEGMAVRWGVDETIVLRIMDELERPDIGWIQQDTIASFWARNPDKIDETNAERQRRFRARKRGMKQLAALAREGRISEALRRERELALKDNPDPEAIIASWAPAAADGVTRYSVTVTPRAEQIINQDAPERAAKVSALGTQLNPIDPAVFADEVVALQWLKGDGEALLIGRTSASKAGTVKQIERWCVTLCGNVTGVTAAIAGALVTRAKGDAFLKLVSDAVARRGAELIGGQQQLKFGPERPVTAQRRETS